MHVMLYVLVQMTLTPDKSVKQIPPVYGLGTNFYRGSTHLGFSRKGDTDTKMQPKT